MKREVGWYVLATIGLGALATGYVAWFRKIVETTVLYDCIIAAIILSIGALFFLLIIEKFGFPTWDVVRQYAKSTSTLFLLWIIVWIISCFV